MTLDRRVNEILQTCFNPYSSGLAVMTLTPELTWLISMGFNPYSSGLAVMTYCEEYSSFDVETRFNPYSSGLAVMTVPFSVQSWITSPFQSLF